MALHDRKWVVEMSAALPSYRHLSAYERERKICAYQYKNGGNYGSRKKQNLIKKLCCFSLR